MSRPASWWWPTTPLASHSLIVLLTLAAVAGALPAGVFGAVFDIVFWYLVFIGTRFLVIQASIARGPTAAPPPFITASPISQAHQEPSKDNRNPAVVRMIFLALAISAAAMCLIVAYNLGVFSAL